MLGADFLRRQDPLAYDRQIAARALELARLALAQAGSTEAAPPLPVLPDAAVIAACAAFGDLERQANATFSDRDRTEAEDEQAEAVRDRLHAQQEPHLDVILATPATTRSGLRAKAQALAIEDLEIMKPGAGDRSECLLHSLLQDLLADPSDAPVAVDGPIASADAGFVALCDETLAARATYFRALADRDAQPESEGQRFEAEMVDPLHHACWEAFRRVLAAAPPTSTAGQTAAARVALAMTSRLRTLYQSQKVTVAAMQMAEKKVWAQRS